MSTVDTEKTNTMLRLFMWTGSVAHLIDNTRPLMPGQVHDRAPSLCGKMPMWPSIWFGLEGEDLELANKLPLCARCVATQEVMAREQHS